MERVRLYEINTFCFPSAITLCNNTTHLRPLRFQGSYSDTLSRMSTHAVDFLTTLIRTAKGQVFDAVLADITDVTATQGGRLRCRLRVAPNVANRFRWPPRRVHCHHR